MGYSGRNNIYEATIKRMVTQALEAQEQAFYDAHAEDTDAQLLAYLRQCAIHLGHTPWPREIMGGGFIEKRFGTWKAALLKANLPWPDMPDNVSGFVRFREERAKQELLYRQKKATKKLLAQRRREQQAKKK